MTARLLSTMTVTGGTLDNYQFDWIPSSSPTALITLLESWTIQSFSASRNSGPGNTPISSFEVITDATPPAIILTGTIPGGSQSKLCSPVLGDFGTPLSLSASVPLSIQLLSGAPLLPEVTVRLTFQLASPGAGAASTAGIASAAVVSGHLIFTRSDATTFDSGDIRSWGDPVVSVLVDATTGHLMLHRASGVTTDCGLAQGTSTATVEGAHLAGHQLFLTLANGTTEMVELAPTPAHTASGWCADAPVSGARVLAFTAVARMVLPAALAGSRANLGVPCTTTASGVTISVLPGGVAGSAVAAGGLSCAAGQVAAAVVNPAIAININPGDVVVATLTESFDADARDFSVSLVIPFR